MTLPGTSRAIEALSAARSEGRAIVAAGVGSGLTASGAAAGGADLLAVYNTAVYRVKNLPTALAFLPYDDCNRITFDAAPEVIAAARGTPVLVGCGVHDPRHDVSRLVDIVHELGATGVTNEPFLGMYDAVLAQQLEGAGLGFGRELEFLRCAVDRGMLGLGWAFSGDEAARLVDAGVQVVGAMVREITAKPGPSSATASVDAALDGAARALGPIVERAHRERSGTVVLLHGGPLSDPASVARVLELTGADGYVTGSSGERHPVEAAVAAAIREFGALRTTERLKGTALET